MKATKLTTATILATVLIFGAFAESAEAQSRRRRARRFSGGSNIGRIIEFDLVPEEPNLQNISFRNPTDLSLLPESLENEAGSNEILAEDSEATVDTLPFSDVNGINETALDIPLDLSNFSEFITFDVDNLSFGRLTLYYFIPDGFDINSITNDPNDSDPSDLDIADLLNLPETIQSTFNAVLEPDTSDVSGSSNDGFFDLTNPDASINSNPAAQPFGNQLNSGLPFEVSETAPEPGTTASLLAMGALGVGVLRKKRAN